MFMEIEIVKGCHCVFMIVLFLCEYGHTLVRVDTETEDQL
jgi:hypothetical protein